MGHIRLAREADLVLVAPATGNFIAKLALGLADDLASTLCLASTAPLYLVPAMNPVMWAHEATQANCATLRARGAVQIGPVSGDTACGEIGSGRMSDVVDIVAAVKAHHHGHEQASLNNKALAGLSVLLTAGPTEEPIDGVRFISNRSSGKQGYAIAEACQKLGAEVTLISGPTALPCPKGVARIDVQTAKKSSVCCAESKVCREYYNNVKNYSIMAASISSSEYFCTSVFGSNHPLVACCWRNHVSICCASLLVSDTICSSRV